MPGDPRLRRLVDVVVIDDVRRFALHLWRFLGGSPGIGIGDISAAERPDDPLHKFFFDDSGKPASLSTSCGRMRVWWVDAGPLWKAQLDAVLLAIRSRRQDGEPEIRPLFVVDVFGREGYDWGEVLARLESLERLKPRERPEPLPDEKPEATDFLVSSFAAETIEQRLDRSDSSRLLNSVVEGRVLAKSPETLNGVRLRAERYLEEIGTASIAAEGDRLVVTDRDVQEIGAASIAAEGDRLVVTDRDVLVTGAGFELRPNRPLIGAGLPRTAEIFKVLDRPFLVRERTAGSGCGVGGPSIVLEPDLEPEKNFLPVPQLESLLAVARANGLEIGREQLPGVPFARTKSLDAWWDAVLLALEDAARRPGPPASEDDDPKWLKQRVERKVQVQRLERSLREAWRRALASYDFGQLSQCISAAQLNWFAWLSTNYTRFADRGIALDRYWQTQQDEGAEVPPEECAAREWRIVDTESEASFLLKELEYREASAVRQDSKLLFKLHGDITHLRTMAIARHDKEPWSPLTYEVEGLHLLYPTAELFLTRYLQEKPGPIRWHIVGHGMKDSSLLDLIVKVLRYGRPDKAEFILVRPRPDTPEDAKVLKAALSHLPGWEIKLCEMTAEEYLERLARGLAIPL